MRELALIAHALMSPRLVLGRADAISIYQGSDIYYVMIQLENQGFLPTYTSQKALERGAVKPIEVNLSLPSGVSLVSGQLKQNIKHLEGRSNKVTNLWAKQGIDYRCHVEWVIKGVPVVKLRLLLWGSDREQFLVVCGLNYLR